MYISGSALIPFTGAVFWLQRADEPPQVRRYLTELPFLGTGAQAFTQLVISLTIVTLYCFSTTEHV